MESAALPHIPGLLYVAGFLDRPTHDHLLRAADAQPWQAGGSLRRVQIYGYAYEHQHRALRRTGDLPDWAHELATRFKNEGLTSELLDYLLINDYEPGTGISPHVDADLVGDAIVSVSLGSTCVMEFADTQSDDTAELLLEPLSALVLSGEARHRWQHAIPARVSDHWMGRTLTRTRRVSLTFRRAL
jgi:alkylated DNA repair dioxygenase AlkB